jgi:hypothetical protein
MTATQTQMLDRPGGRIACYPQAEMPDVVNPALVRFCQEAAAGA